MSLSSGAKAKVKSHLPLLAVAADGPLHVVEALLEAKTDVNQVHSTTGHTALHLAAKAGRADIAQLIIDEVDSGASAAHAATDMLAMHRGLDCSLSYCRVPSSMCATSEGGLRCTSQLLRGTSSARACYWTR